MNQIFRGPEFILFHCQNHANLLQGQNQDSQDLGHLLEAQAENKSRMLVMVHMKSHTLQQLKEKQLLLLIRLITFLKAPSIKEINTEVNPLTNVTLLSAERSPDTPQFQLLPYHLVSLTKVEKVADNNLMEEYQEITVSRCLLSL